MTTYPVIISFILYFLTIVSIAIVASKLIKNMSDYILAGRKLSGAVTALGAGASDMSGWLMLALPGAIYAIGIHQIWMPIGLLIGAFLNWTFVARRLRIYTELAGDAQTIPAFFNNRFRESSHWLRITTATVILVFFTIYAAAGFVGCAILIQATFDVSYEQGLMIGALVIVIYTTIGGFLAVNWIDFFQGTLMLCALLLVPFVTFTQFDSFDAIIQIIYQSDSTLLNFFNPRELGLISIISLLSWGLGYFGQPHILVRFMAITSPDEVSKARLIGMTWMILALIGAVFTGLFGIAYFIANPLSNPETVFLELGKLLFNPWIFGILVAAVASAIMSTVSAQLLASASSLVDDFYSTFFRKEAKQKELLLVSRACVLVVAILAIIIASDPNSQILSLVAISWAGITSAFGPLILFSLYWKRITHSGAIAGIVTGALTVIIWQQLAKLDIPIFQLYSILPGFVLSCLATMVVSLVGWPKKKIVAEFERIEQKQ